jgi:hypothetical protein
MIGSQGIQDQIHETVEISRLPSLTLLFGEQTAQAGETHVFDS